MVELAMVLRGKPDSFTCLLPMLRVRPKYQGEDKLPLIVWMMAQVTVIFYFIFVYQRVSFVKAFQLTGLPR